MNITKIFRTAVTILSVSLLSISNSCSERNETVSCFPNSAISAQLNLNFGTYSKLQNVGGWIYENQIGSGTRGLIVVRVTSGFKVYDRNAPHICPDTNTTLEVKDDIKIICPNDGAEWILSTGQPLNSQAKTAPKTYSYSYDQNTNVLSIYN